LKLKKVKELSKVPLGFFGQIFHENCLFVEAFEIVIKINASLILIFFQKTRTEDSWNLKYSKS
jgi:hypothetical protein